MGVYSQNADTSMLQRSVRSVLTQSYREFEFLICCDGSSSPEVYSLLEQICQEDERVRLIREEKAFSLAMKLNICLLHAKGRYIARMDDDDWCHPNRFEKQRAFLDKHHEYGFVGCNVQIFRNGEVYGRRKLPEVPQKTDFLFVQPYIHPALMFRKECFELAGFYCEDLRCIRCEDFDLLLRFVEKGLSGYNLPETLLTYTIPGISAKREKYRWRVNYALTRFKRFKALGMLPGAFPYVVKPLIVGLLPVRLLDWLKKGKIYFLPKE